MALLCIAHRKLEHELKVRQEMPLETLTPQCTLENTVLLKPSAAAYVPICCALDGSLFQPQLQRNAHGSFVHRLCLRTRRGTRRVHSVYTVFKGLGRAREGREKKRRKKKTRASFVRALTAFSPRHLLSDSSFVLRGGGGSFYW